MVYSGGAGIDGGGGNRLLTSYSCLCELSESDCFIVLQSLTQTLCDPFSDRLAAAIFDLTLMQE